MGFFELTFLLAVWNAVTTFKAAALSELKQPHNEQDRLRAASRHTEKPTTPCKWLLDSLSTVVYQLCPWGISAAVNGYPKASSVEKMNLATTDLEDGFVAVHSFQETFKTVSPDKRGKPIQDPTRHAGRFQDIASHSDMDDEGFVILQEDSNRREDVNAATTQVYSSPIPTKSACAPRLPLRFAQRPSLVAAPRASSNPSTKTVTMLPALSMGFEIVNHPRQEKQQKPRLSGPPKPPRGVFRKPVKDLARMGTAC